MVTDIEKKEINNRNTSDAIYFNFSYAALKLLGKNLYNNAANAISELVANGLDAKAKNVYVYIDMSDKEHSIIEIIDDGIGMDYADLAQKYVWIGRNKRNDADLLEDEKKNVMGRKGIGKLAALYLSNNYISKNPCKQIHPIKYEAKLREPLTGVEMELIRDACQTRREKAIIETFYSTGCRVSELAILKKTDVDFRKGEVHLFGKGSKHRISYINAKAEVALKKYLFSRSDDCPALFVTDRSPVRALKKEGIESIVRKIGERSGIERRVYPHLIRHTTATDALERGMNVAEVQKILGHEKLDTTMIYAKVCQDNVKYDHKRYIV